MTALLCEAEREALRQRWRDLRGSRMLPISTSVGRCPSCGRVVGVDTDGLLNRHRDSFDNPASRCPAAGQRAAEVTPL